MKVKSLIVSLGFLVGFACFALLDTNSYLAFPAKWHKLDGLSGPPQALLKFDAYSHSQYLCNTFEPRNEKNSVNACVQDRFTTIEIKDNTGKVSTCIDYVCASHSTFNWSSTNHLNKKGGRCVNFWRFTPKIYTMPLLFEMFL